MSSSNNAFDCDENVYVENEEHIFKLRDLDNSFYRKLFRMHLSSREGKKGNRQLRTILCASPQGIYIQALTVDCVFYLIFAFRFSL